MTAHTVITIDGPAGAGKSTIARALSKRLGCVFLDTGAIYRTVALACERAGHPWRDEAAVCLVANGIVASKRMRFTIVAGEQRVMLDEEDVTDAIRTPEISQGASVVSAHPKVRDALLSLQREAAEHGSLVVEGRDTGTVVFPNATVKFFLTATPQQRAKRRCLELTAKGVAADFDETLRSMQERDRRDEERAAAPLKRADDAIDVDTTLMSIEEVLDAMVGYIESRRC